MSPNILITGATGYIGGSVLAGLLSNETRLVSKSQVHALVRSEEQAEALSKLGVNVVLGNLRDEASVSEAILTHNIDFIIHTASALDPEQARHLISSLGKRRTQTNDPLYFIHTSGTTAWTEYFGFPPGAVKDTDSLFEKEKEFADTYPVRKTDVTVIEEAEKIGVTSFIVTPPTIYGRGSGEWNKLSAMIPSVINAAISRKTVNKFEKDSRRMLTHISDLTEYYMLLIEKILRGAELPSGKSGYYFAVTHRFRWWDVMDRIAEALKARGLVDSSDTPVWPSLEVAQDTLGLPPGALNGLWMSDEYMIAENKDKLGWVPKWNEAKLLEQINDEVKDVLEIGIEKILPVTALLYRS